MCTYSVGFYWAIKIRALIQATTQVNLGSIMLSEKTSHGRHKLHDPVFTNYPE